MKKVIIFLFLIISISLVVNDKEEIIFIPDEAIRFRIIANSNETQDQLLKLNVKEKLDSSLAMIENAENINESRDNIEKVIPVMENTLDSLNLSYNINYGKNYFPEKSYNNVIYKAGNYESLVITIGEGKGDNWWCVLFPPLCMLDKENENNEYSFYVKNILKEYY